MFVEKCPHCCLDLQMQDEWIGMEAACPQCQKTFIVGKSLSSPEQPECSGDEAEPLSATGSGCRFSFLTPLGWLLILAWYIFVVGSTAWRCCDYFISYHKIILSKDVAAYFWMMKPVVAKVSACLFDYGFLVNVILIWAFTVVAAEAICRLSGKIRNMDEDALRKKVNLLTVLSIVSGFLAAVVSFLAIPDATRPFSLGRWELRWLLEDHISIAVFIFTYFLLARQIVLLRRNPADQKGILYLKIIAVAVFCVIAFLLIEQSIYSIAGACYRLSIIQKKPPFPLPKLANYPILFSLRNILFFLLPFLAAQKLSVFRDHAPQTSAKRFILIFTVISVISVGQQLFSNWSRKVSGNYHTMPYISGWSSSIIYIGFMVLFFWMLPDLIKYLSEKKRKRRI